MSDLIDRSARQRPAAELARAAGDGNSVRECLLEGELSFYQRYPWCLDLYPTVGETIEHLHVELDRLGRVQESWQTAEVMRNVFLLSCSLLNSADEYLGGDNSRLPKKLPAVPFSRSVLAAAEKLAGNLFLDLLQAADRRRSTRLLRALLDFTAYQLFGR